MEREETRFTMRIDAGLFAMLKILAGFNKRSTVKEIEYILEQYLIDYLKNHQSLINQSLDFKNSGDLIAKWQSVHNLTINTTETNI